MRLVNLGSVHEIDELIYDILDSENKIPDIDEARTRLAEKYNESGIVEAFEDIKELIDKDLLYSKDSFELEQTKGKNDIINTIEEF